MLDLYDEFKSVIAALNDRGIAYAVCGGLAMAVHGLPRATIDMDLLIRVESLDEVLAVARELGYTLPAKPMTFAGGDVEIHRRSKPDPDGGDVVMIDLLLVTPAVDQVWKQREEVVWQEGRLSVVSREGLIALKTLRSSSQDLADIERLKEKADES